MIKLTDLNLTTPFKLIHPDFKSIEIVTNINYLNYQTTQGIKEKSLENCIIEDVSNNQFYKIIDIIVLGRKNTWWIFEFFNPLLKVNLVFEKIEDSLCLNKLHKLSIISNEEILEGRY